MKRVAKASRIEIREGADKEWSDVSYRVSGWGMTAMVGELYLVDLVLNYNRDAIQIVPDTNFSSNDAGDATYRVPAEDVIRVDGVDLSRLIHGYSIDTKVGAVETVTLNLFADKDMLRINGVHPWEEPAWNQ